MKQKYINVSLMPLRPIDVVDVKLTKETIVQGGD